MTELRDTADLLQRREEQLQRQLARGGLLEAQPRMRGRRNATALVQRLPSFSEQYLVLNWPRDGV